MYELTIQQQFVQQFRDAAPQYTQPVQGYRVEAVMTQTFDLAWPLRKIAVEFSHSPLKVNPPGWKVFSLARYSTESIVSFIYNTLIPALDA
jgi:hypothetical protein